MNYGYQKDKWMETEGLQNEMELSITRIFTTLFQLKISHISL